jgi:imidazolonepropionase-like amidohydrolase
MRPFVTTFFLGFLSHSVAASCLLVHTGELIDVPGNAPHKMASLWIADGRVAGIRDGHVAINAFSDSDQRCEFLDLSDYTVLPGLIDSHVHLSSDKAGVEAQLAAVTMSVADVTLDAVVNARKTIDAGFTTVRNLGDNDGVTLALRDAIAAGKVVGPRIIDAGNAISVTSGHMDDRLGYAEFLHASFSTENICDGADACRTAVRIQIGRGVDVIKMATTGGVNSRVGAGVGQQMFDDEARAIVQTAHLGGKKVAVHAHGADGILLALQMGADSIEHGTLLDDAGIALMKKNGAFLVPTLSTINGYKERLAANPNAYSPEVKAKIQWRIGITGKSFKRAHDAGVRIAFGTDAGVSMHGRNADEFELMVQFGMTPTQAIIAATLNAAELLGVQADLGSLAVGKQADFIAVKGDPLKDVTLLKNVVWVVQKGVVVKQPTSE